MNLLDIKLKKRQSGHLIIIGIILIVVAVLGVVRVFSDSVNGNSVVIPEDFLTARSNAGEITEEITDLARESKRNLNAIRDADRAEDYSGGLELVKMEIDRNTHMRIAAVELTEELKIMAIQIQNIEPDEASDIGLQSVTTGLELTQHLVNYNNYTYELLNIIQYRLEEGGVYSTKERIEDTLLSMNTEVDFVNSLNEEYKNLALKFDSVTILEK